METKGKANIHLENEKGIYAFLSKTIYNELIEEGIDQENILTLSLYLHWTVIREYTTVSSKSNIYNTKAILKETQTVHMVGEKAYSLNLNNFVDTLFIDNSEFLRSVYHDVCQTNGPIKWLTQWQNLCRHSYQTNQSKIGICLTLLKIVNECLDIPYNKTDISLALLIRIQENDQNV